jgi:CRP/FNR family transcriptional regulator, cyclic AMP receptor protein
VTVVAAVGYLASALVFATFWMKAAVPLRQVAIASNVVFFSYGVMDRAVPIAVLHGLLLPLNVWRLSELVRLQSKIQSALAGDFSLEWLRRFAATRSYSQGDYIFQRGQVGSEMYYVLNGTVRLPEINVELGKGDLLGEMAPFSAHSTRLLSALCVNEVELMTIDSGTVAKLFYQDPHFGFYLLRLITQRLERDVELLRGLVQQHQEPGT